MRYHQCAAPSPDGEQTTYVMSEGNIDRMGDVIEPDSWQLANFVKHPIALFNHDRDQVIGVWKNVQVKGGQLLGQLQLAEAGTSALVDTIRSLVHQGILRAVSVGFRALKAEPLDEKADKNFGPFRFLKTELLECSLVSVPANPAALAIAKGLPAALVRELFRKPASEQPTGSAQPHGVSAKRSPMTGQKTMTTGTLAQRIQSATTNYNALRDSLNELLAKDDMSEDEQKRYDELPPQIEAAKAELDKHKRAERALVDGNTQQRDLPAALISGEILAPLQPIIEQKAQLPAIPQQLDRRLLSNSKKKVEQGDHTLRSLVAWTRATAQHENDLGKALRDAYGQGDEMTSLVLRAAVNPAMTTVATWAAELVQTEQQGFLDRLIPDFLYPKLTGMGQRFTFGPAGLIKIPVRASTPTLAGNWVGEGAPKPVRRAAFSLISLSPTKMSVISTFTEEMAMYSIPTIEAIIRKAMGDDTGIALDTYLIDAVASSATRPAGLLNGVTPITASAATPASAAMLADLKALIGALQTAGAGRSGQVAILINPAQALSIGLAVTANGDFVFDGIEQAGAKFGARFIVSSTVPAGRVIAVDTEWFASAAGDSPRFAVSTDATLHEEDTTPLAIGTAGAPATIAAPTRSLFQTDAVAIRMSMYVTWSMLRPGMVQTINPVIW